MMVFSKTSAALESSLHAQWQRIATIGHNISNEDTPGYQTKRVSFEDALLTEIERAEGSRMRYTVMDGGKSAYERLASLQPEEYALEGLEGRADGNNVDLINEQTELARVQIQYQALRQRISGYYSNLQYAMTGGR
jgi:flagellar basal-body rod protein FlgB